MAKINILDSSIYNRIAAGEVVERPKSIVKELVENSIDAGSSEISVDIIDGGITEIIVTDNGIGIDRENLRNAFMPHATSKINSADDLDTIATLGFRGEALPSIASISKIELQSCSIENEDGNGNILTIEGGKEVAFKSVNCNYGTKISVRNIFYNTPARQKFLKKAKGEESDITTTISNLILANPNIAFRYTADGKLIYSSNGRGLEDALYSVYPKSVTANVLPVYHEERNYIIKGYVSKPEYTKPNRSYQTCILNGRIISNTTISTAVLNAYGNILMKRMFPMFILDIVMPFDEVDVNVTPNKSDVRFLDNNKVYSIVFHSVKNALDKNIKIFDGKLFDSKKDNINLPNSENNSINNVNSELYNNILSNIDNNIKNDIRTDLSKNTIYDKISEIKNIKVEDKINIPSPNKLLKVQDSGTISIKKPEIKQSSLFEDVETLLTTDYTVIGQLFNTYLLISKGDSVFLIDQHAGHERLLYDKLREQMDVNNIVTQPLLIPQIIELNNSDSIYLNSLLSDLAKIGLEIEEFGSNSFKVYSIPMTLVDFNFRDFMNYVLDDKNKLSQIKLKDVLHNRLAISACKAAIKAGDKLNDYQINALLKMMVDNTPVQCPHGRPAIIKITRKDIDKIFKRII